jgi:hypothetical protein
MRGSLGYGLMLVACAVLCTSVLAATGCGDDSGAASPAADREEIGSLLTAAQRAYEREDFESVCKLLSPGARRQVGAAAGHPPADCRSGLAETSALAARRKSGVAPERQRVGRIAVHGDRAQALVSHSADVTLNVPLVREDGSWRIDAVYGDLPAGRQPERSGSNSVAHRPVWDAEGLSPLASGDVKAERVFPDGTKVGCSAVDASAPPAKRGGCVLDAEGPSMRVQIHSAFGDTLSRTCDLSLRAWFSGTGEVLVSVAPGRERLCPAMVLCRRQYGQPFEGVLVPNRARQFILRLQTCLDADIGRFAGDLTSVLRPDGVVIRMSPSPKGVGRSGWVFDGDWMLRASDPSYSVSLRIVSGAVIK